MSTILVRLPDAMRGELKDPIGTLYTDVESLLAAVDGPLITVGDLVTYHLQQAGRAPDVAVIDFRTERIPVEPAIEESLPGADIEVPNPAGTITTELVRAIVDAISTPEPTVIHVEGEEDLAVLPAILASSLESSVVYGQPGEGMVHVVVTDEIKTRIRDIVSRMDGEPDEMFALVS